jgi:hypothetical protein
LFIFCYKKQKYKTFFLLYLKKGRFLFIGRQKYIKMFSQWYKKKVFSNERSILYKLDFQFCHLKKGEVLKILFSYIVRILTGASAGRLHLSSTCEGKEIKVKATLSLKGKCPVLPLSIVQCSVTSILFHLDFYWKW